MNQQPPIIECPVIDFHTHTLLSDGELGPAELARRALVSGYQILGLADHVDCGTMPDIIRRARASAQALKGHLDGLVILPGVELTHLPPALIGDMVKKARDLGASHVVVHGESLVEPVAPGTNLAAIKAGADILAHPGLLTAEETALAAERGVFLELSYRGGHSLGNGHTVVLARQHGAKLLVNSDGHKPGDYLTPKLQMAVALGSGLSPDEYRQMMLDARELADKLIAISSL